jgi:hypothetical protein
MAFWTIHVHAPDGSDCEMQVDSELVELCGDSVLLREAATAVEVLLDSVRAEPCHA